MARSNGSVTTHLPSHWDEGLAAFRFPLIGVERADGRVSARFDGAVRMRAHGGALDVLLVDPVVEFSATGVRLTIETEWDDDFARIEVATLDADPATALALAPGAPLPDMTAAASLSGHGPAWLGGVYPGGTTVDPVRFIAGSPAPT